MLKFGTISEVNIEKGLARVYFEEDDFVSGWLKIGVPRAGTDQFSFPFQVKEHVYCIMDEDWEYGVVAGSVYDESNIPNGSAEGLLQWRFRDDSVISYNVNTRTLSLDIKGEINIKCEQANIESTGEIKVKASKISIEAITTKIDGILQVSGAAVIQGVVSMGGLSGIDGAAVSGSDAELEVKKITASDDVIAGVINLKTHRHTSTGPGSPTSPAIP